MIWKAICVFLLSLSLSVDDFAAGTAYGLRKTLIPWRSMAALIFSSTLTMFAFMWLGSLVFGMAGSEISKFISMVLLCGLGLRELINVWREDHQTHWHKKLTVDLNKTVNIWEAFYLGAALGVDDFAEAIGLGVAGFPVALTVFFFKLSEVIMISTGMYLAYRGMAVHKVNERIKYIPGIILIGVGIKQLF